MKEQIYEALVAQNDKHRADKNQKLFEDGRDIWIRTSMLSMCERKVVYHGLKYPEGPQDPNSLVTLGIGTMVHELAQGALEKDGWIANLEAEVYFPEYHLNGHRDGDCYLDSDNQHLRIFEMADGNRTQVRQPNAIWEFKTINADGFATLLFKRKPKEDHVRQVNTYMGLTGYKKAVITYINKNGLIPRIFSMDAEKNAGLKDFLKGKDHYLMDFVVDFNEELWYNTVEKLKRLNQAIASGKELDRTWGERHEGQIIQPSASEELKRRHKDHQTILPPKIDSNYECGFCAYKYFCRTRAKSKVDN